MMMEFEATVTLRFDELSELGMLDSTGELVAVFTDAADAVLGETLDETLVNLLAALSALAIEKLARVALEKGYKRLEIVKLVGGRVVENEIRLTFLVRVQQMTT